MLSSDQEKETSESKKGDDSLWKFRPPKKCSKYVPGETQAKTDKKK